MKKQIISLITILAIYITLMPQVTESATSERTVSVSTVAELRQAVSTAAAGDEIIVASGTYDVTGLSGSRGGVIQARDISGTEEKPILLRSADPDNPARIVSTNVESGMLIHIWGGAYWIIQDLEIQGGQKGIVFDNTNNSVIRGCYVFGCGQEAIHLRDGSDDCTVLSNKITDTGLHSKGYGEGVYVGNAASSTGYAFDCDRNIISHNVIERTAADNIDIKEGSSGTVVEYNIFYGEGITGENSSTSNIYLRGSDSIIRYNVFYRNQNPKLRAAVEIFKEDGILTSGVNNAVYGNEFYLDLDAQSTWHYNTPNNLRPPYAVGAWKVSSTFVSDNYIEKPVTIGNYSQFTAFDGAVITHMPTGTYPPIDPTQTPGLIENPPWRNTPVSEPPSLTGRLVYHSYDAYGDGSSQLFVYDFGSNELECISENWTNVTDPMNAVWTEDGKALVFMGVDTVTDEPWSYYTWDVFYYEIGSQSDPANLTNEPFTRNEDPKIYGDTVVYKAIHHDLAEDESCNYVRTVSLTDFTISTIYASKEIETAMPIYSYDGSLIYFSGLRRDNGTAEMDLYSIPADGNNMAQKIPGCSQPGKFEYYQAVNENGFFFAAHSESGSDMGDKVYYKNTVTDEPPVLMPFNAGAETADPCVVNADYTIVSSIRGGGAGNYDLYLCNNSTGEAFPLSLLNAGINTSKGELAAWYTPTVEIVDVPVFEIKKDSPDSDLIRLTNLTNRAVSTKGFYISRNENELEWQMPAIIVRTGESVFIRDGSGFAEVFKRAWVDYDISEVGELFLYGASGNLISEWR